MEDRAIPGHWESDLLRGSGNNHIATLLERHSRFVTLIKVPSRDTVEVVGAWVNTFLNFPLPCDAR